MYLEYWGFNRFPFDNVPDPSLFYMSRVHEEGLTRLLYAVKMKKGCALLSGDIGCGKTILSMVLLDRICNTPVMPILISSPVSDPLEFLQDFLYRLNVEDIPDKMVEVLRVLNHKLIENINAGKDTILIIDEAQILSEDALEQVRLLLNFQLRDRFLLTILLLGQPELVEKVRNIKQLEQRVAIKFVLKPFDLRDTAKYILFRQSKAGGRNVFTKQAIEAVYRYSTGIPRNINRLCDMALLVAYGEKRENVNSKIVHEIVEDGSIF